MTEPSTDLLRSAGSGCTADELQRLLAQRADIHAETDRGQSPLQLAAKAGHAHLVEALAAAGADPNLGNSCDGTPLYIAAYHDNEEVVDVLLRCRADINLAFHHCPPPLFGAAHTGNMKLVQKLLAQRANVNERANWDQSTAILQTSLFGYTEVVKELVAARADVNVRRTDTTIMDCGATSVLLAAKRGHAETVRLLLESRCSVNASNTNSESPLFGATLRNHPETVQVLLENRADLHQRSEHEEMPTALHAASSKDSLEIAQLLMIAKADLTSVSPAGHVVLAVTKVEACAPLLEAAAQEAIARVSDIQPSQMMLLMQGLLPLGGEHPALNKMADNWAASFYEAT
ncbi:unnamed protein product, partial [Symbiodinium microadriaticum]